MLALERHCWLEGAEAFARATHLPPRRSLPPWKADSDEHEPVRLANGSQGEWLVRDAANPQEFLLLLASDDLERVRLFADSDHLCEAMARARVIDRSAIRFLEEGACLNV